MYSRFVVNIITWRGLAALLILGKGQCEGLNAGMSESRISHAFFVSISLSNMYGLFRENWLQWSVNKNK